MPCIERFSRAGFAAVAALALLCLSGRDSALPEDPPEGSAPGEPVPGGGGGDLWQRNRRCDVPGTSCIGPSTLKCCTYTTTIAGQSVVVCIEAPDL